MLNSWTCHACKEEFTSGTALDRYEKPGSVVLSCPKCGAFLAELFNRVLSRDELADMEKTPS